VSRLSIAAGGPGRLSGVWFFGVLLSGLSCGFWNSIQKRGNEMRGVNKVVLVGNLGAEPEVKFTSSGKAVAKLSIATNETYRNAAGDKVQHTEWHRVTLWEKRAELAGEYLHKGDPVYIEGKLQTSKYEKGGVDHYSTEIICLDLVFLGGKKNGAPGDAPTGKVPDSSGSDTTITDNDIPF
jgi:single-strand DNA-binding protein